MSTFDEHGFVEPGLIVFQVKAMENLAASGSDFVYDLDVRDYNLWVREILPVILILFDASHRRAYWLAIQSYFENDLARQPKKGARSVRVRVPQRQVLNRGAIVKMRDMKWLAAQNKWEDTR